MTEPQINPSQIRRFPRNPKARIKRVGKHIYVMVPAPQAEGRAWRITGKIVDNTYWNLEEYHRVFKRDGTRRKSEVVAGNRKYQRRRHAVPRLQQADLPPRSGVPDRQTVKNFPFYERNARIIRVRRTGRDGSERISLHVVLSRHIWVNGQSRDIRTYIGRIVDNVYYSAAEYRRRFRRDGTPRVKPKP